MAGGESLRVAVAIAALGLLLPVASAAQGALSFETARPLALAGDAVVTFARGEGSIVHDPELALPIPETGRASLTLDATRANVTLYTWRMLYSDEAQRRIEDPRPETFDLVDETLTWNASDGLFGMGILSTDEGRVRVEGSVDGEGRLARVLEPSDRTREIPVWSQGVPNLDIGWEAGWIAVGTADLTPAPLDAFPGLVAPRLRASGGVFLSLQGGNVTFGGETYRLGEWDEGTTLPGGARIAWHREAILAMEAGEALIEPSGVWGFAGPEVELAVSGTLSATDATGRATFEEQERTFRGAAVESRLDAQGPAAPSRLRVTDDAYVLTGDFDDLRVDGAPLVAPETRSFAAPAATLTAGALLVLLVTKVGQSLLAAGAASLYTRLSPGDLLHHPQRARLHELVLAEPGIHQRELHRRLGGAWGPFAFHLRMLAKAGHVRVVKQGAYTLVVPATGHAGAVASHAIPHPVARAVFDALPANGAPLPLADLVSRVGVSRELVGYHLRGLEARGLVTRLELDGSRRAVARAAQAAAGEAPPLRA